MRYLCLVYGTEDSLPVMQNPNPMSRAEVDVLTQGSLAYNDVLRTSGHFIVARALQSVRTVDHREGAGRTAPLTDRPFAETKEQLLGFVLIEAKDRDDAVEVAFKSRCAPRQHRGAVDRGPSDRPVIAWSRCRGGQGDDRCLC